MPPDVPVRIVAAALAEISGREAVAFAQAQFASDVSTLEPGAWQWSAWLDAQGRVRHVFALLMASPQQLLAWLPLGDAAALAGELARFVLRSKVGIRTPPDWHVLLDTAAPPAPGVLADDSLSGAFALAATPGTRIVLSPDATAAVDDDGRARETLLLAGIHAGLPWLDAPLAGEFVAAALDLGRIGAASLGKGCYPGQEIVARLHYRGGNKRHLRHLVFPASTTTRPGDAVLAGHGDAATRCGRVLYAATTADGIGHALAVIDEGGEADAALTVAGGSQVSTVRAFSTLAR
ncbi:MAG: folate-binding protein [Xanthomonadales bacterium]|nr:folate-binding protein [Xanthomonadales bacterium]